MNFTYLCFYAILVTTGVNLKFYISIKCLITTDLLYSMHNFSKLLYGADGFKRPVHSYGPFVVVGEGVDCSIKNIVLRLLNGKIDNMYVQVHYLKIIDLLEIKIILLTKVTK